MQGRRHLENVLMQKLVTETGYRLCNGGFHENQFPYPIGATVLGYRDRMEFKHVIDVEKLRIHSASSFSAAR